MNKKKICIIVIIIIVVLILISGVVYFSRKKNQYIQENETGGMGRQETDSEIIEKYDLKIVNVPKEVEEKLQNSTKIYNELKKYVYINGFVTAKEATCKKYEIENNEMKIRFNLDDIRNTRILLKINLSTNETQFDYYQ